MTIEDIDKVLREGADIDAFFGRCTALAWVAQHGDESLVTHLLKCGASIEKDHSNEQSPLAFAAQRGRANVASVLLEAGAGIDRASYRGWTPVMYAARNGHVAVADLLLRSGADVLLRDLHG